MDPQQRLLLECTEEAFTAARFNAHGSAVPDAAALMGVFVGISTPDYSTVAQAHADISPYSATGAGPPGCCPYRLSLAARIRDATAAVATLKIALPPPFSLQAPP